MIVLTAVQMRTPAAAATPPSGTAADTDSATSSAAAAATSATASGSLSTPETTSSSSTSTMIKFDRFEAVMIRIFIEHLYEPDDEDTLLAAFRVFDPEGKGYITEGLPFLLASIVLRSAKSDLFGITYTRSSDQTN